MLFKVFLVSKIMVDTKQLLAFLRSQRLMVLASQGEEVWISNVYYGVTEDFTFYFISSKVTKHSEQILKNPKVAFSIVWFDPQNHKDRKAVQGSGVCRLASSEEGVETGVRLHNELFPEFKERITVDWITSESNESQVWILKPSYMKFWNDQLYGEQETEEFHF